MTNKLTEDNYFSVEANMQYMGVSQFKTFEQCEFRGLAEARGEYERPFTTALLVGSYVDAYFGGLNELDRFRLDHPELFKRDGELKAEYKAANNIIGRIGRDDLFRKYMSGENQVIMTGEIAGVPVKIKMDSYHPGQAIVDLKVMRDFQPIFVPGAGRLNFVEAWRYDLQGAIYQEIVRQNTGDKLPFFIAAVTKETVPDLGIFKISQEVMDAQLAIFEANAPRYQLIKEGKEEPIRCERCDLCKQTKKLNHITTWEELNNYGNQ